MATWGLGVHLGPSPNGVLNTSLGKPPRLAPKSALAWVKPCYQLPEGPLPTTPSSPLPKLWKIRKRKNQGGQGGEKGKIFWFLGGEKIA